MEKAPETEPARKTPEESNKDKGESSSDGWNTNITSMAIAPILRRSQRYLRSDVMVGIVTSVPSAPLFLFALVSFTPFHVSLSV